MRRAATVLLLFSLIMVSAFACPSAFAKKWTVTERMQKLSKEIDEGRKANELTAKQVESLKKDVIDIQAKMDKMKAKNDGKLSIPDTKKLHDEMTAVSVKIYKERMDNVYSD